jgi:hypothetical protein
MAEEKQTESDMTKEYNRVGDNEDGADYFPLTGQDKDMERFPGPDSIPAGGDRADNVDPFRIP